MHAPTLRSKLKGCTQPLSIANRHIFWNWDPFHILISDLHIAYAYAESPYRIKELRKHLYQLFYHSAKKLYILIRRSSTEGVSPHTLELAEYCKGM